MSENIVSRNVLLIFNKEIMYNPVIFWTTQKFNISFNVLEAKILPKQEGRLILQLKGDREQLDQAIDFMQQEHVVVEILSDRIKRDEEQCIHCGACTGVCKTNALWIDRETMQVMFEPENCIVCGQCELICPVNAISVASIDMDILH
jgi:ferredoxin